MYVEIIKPVNLALRFLLELCILVALGYWGLRTGQATIVKIGLGSGAPLLAAVTWGVLLAPNSSTRLHKPWRLMLEVILFGLAIAALYVAAPRGMAWAFGLIYAINKILMYVWRQ